MAREQIGQARWSPEDLGRFVDQVRNDQHFALWMLIATTGIRIDALLDLRRGDVDLQDARLCARPVAATRAGSTPLGVTKTYALDPDTHEALREHVIAWDSEHSGQDLRSKHLFAWEDGEPMHPKSVDVLFHRHCHKADLPVVPLQAVRQAYVVAALETGIPTAVISERLGHAVSTQSISLIPTVNPPERPGPTASHAPTRRRVDAGREQARHLRSC